MKRNQQKKRKVPPQTGEASRILQIAICIFLVAATLAVYWQILDHGFLNYDDSKYVTKNWQVQSGLTLESVKWAFSTEHFAQWHPITWLSHIIDFQLFGSDPSGHHLVSLSIHIANALLLFLVLTRMTGASWQSGFVAAVFALHPFNVESVAWIAERKNVLSTFFWLLTMWSYIRYVEKPSIIRYGLILFFLTIGLMTKPMLVTLPFVLLLLDFWPLGRWKFSQKNRGTIHSEEGVRPAKLIWEKIPFFIIVIGSSITTFIVTKSGGALQGMEVHSLLVRISNSMVSSVTYLAKTFWPSGLSVFYPHPGNALPAWQVITSIGLLSVISFVAVRWIKSVPYFAFGWFWFLGTLVPVIQIVQTGAHAMADRYAYVPLIGIFIIVAWGLPDLLARWNHREKAPAIFAGLLIPLMIATSIQVGLWENGITLFKHAIRVTNKKYSDIASTHALLANACHRKGELSLAISEFKKSLEINPEHLYSLNNLAGTLAEQGNLEGALLYARKSVSLESDYIPGLVTLGNILEESGELNQAQTYYERVLELESESFENHLNLANVLYKTGDIAEATLHFRETIALNPRLVEAHYNLGNALGQQGQLKEAQEAFEQAITLDEKLPLPHYGLGIIHLRAGQYSKAIKAFEQALTLNPKLEQAQHFLAEAHDKMKE
ncbi:MAG: tetratricopeptide repeat protein [Nitrospina sp.]|nr:tetratricopeptide repeat protein [Nitrospina sp.]